MASLHSAPVGREPGLLRAIRRSVFLKLLLIFFVTAVLLFTLVGGAARYFSDPERLAHTQLQKVLGHYVDHLMNEIGAPPDQERARLLADELGLVIAFTTVDGTWSSQPVTLPAGRGWHRHTLGQRDNMEAGHRRGVSYVTATRNGNTYTFILEHQRFAGQAGWFLASLVVILAVVLGASYLAVRWLLKPVRWLDAGVQALAKGNLDYRVPVRKHDELGELAGAFNQMSDRVQSMMQSKQQLLLDVSHELRSPITRTKLALEFVSDADARARIDQDVREMETMLTELLESARLDADHGALHKARLDLTATVRRVAQHYTEQKPGIDVIAADTPVWVDADADRVQIVLRNVLDNAVKYSAHQRRPVRLVLTTEDNWIKIEVHDFGTGIPAPDIEHIFEPFYRVDKSRSTGGYGLGLSLCKKIMQAHGGDITVRIEPDVETVFTIRLPVS